MGITSKTARDAYFLTDYDRSLLPLMFLVVAVGVALILPVYTRAANRLSNTQIFISTGLLFISTFVVSQFFIQGWVIPVLYVWVDVVGVIMLIQFWEFTSESFESRQAKRVFGIIGGGGSFAAMLIGLGLKPFVNIVGTDWLLVLAAGFIGISLIFGLFALRHMDTDEMSVKPNPSSKKPKKQKMDSFLMEIAIVIALSAVVTTIVDYQFKIIAAETFPAKKDLVGFFGNFYAVTGFASLVMQFFISGPVLSRFGILAGLMILPLMLIAGSGSVLLAPVILSVAFAKFSDQTFKFTINSSSLELLWLPVPTAKRKAIKPLISGTIKASAEGVAGLATYFIVKFIALQYLSMITLGSIIIWLFTTFKLKAGYVQALMSAIEKRQLDFEELTLDIQDAAMVSTIEKTLNSKEKIKQIFALELIDGLPLHPWKSSLQKLFASGSLDVRKRLLDLAWDEEDIFPDEVIISAMEEENGVSNEAILAAGKREISSVIPTLEILLDNEEKESQASAAAAILHMDGGPDEKAKLVLTQMLNSSNEPMQIIALKKLDKPLGVLPIEKLIPFLENPSPEISLAALNIAKNRKDDLCIPSVVTNLDIPQTAFQARDVLKVFSQETILEHFKSSLKDISISRKRKLGIIRTLKEYPSKLSIQLLFQGMDISDFQLYQEAIDSILSLARIQPLDDESLNRISVETHSLAGKIYSFNEILNLLPENESNFLLKDYVENEIAQMIPALMKLGVMDVPDTPVETYIHTIKSGEISQLSFVLEFFENIFTKEERKIITPLIEPITPNERSQIGKNHFSELPNSLDAELTKSAYSPNKWESVITLDYLFKTNKIDLAQSLNWEKIPNSKANKELITRRIHQNGVNLDFLPKERFKFDMGSLSMYSTLEKTIILKTVSLFKSIPAENLSRISQITEEVQYQKNEPIFAEGDYGDSLFIIVEGKVRIHKGNQELAELGKGAFLGEMALLDQEPRSADATVTEEATLLKITQDGFYEVMGSNSEIMEGIIKLLTGRLREANEKLMVK